jgi:[methyl-Co(III) methanol-specific corrinoid protein]:coenzyme M methyltransferase
MMSMAVTEVMDASGASWPEAHSDAPLMARLALSMRKASDFDSVAVPFCMTVEAESFGAPVDMGSPTIQPRPAGRLFEPEEEFALPRPDFTLGRAGVLLEAIRIARRAAGDFAVIGNVVGPFSLLAMLTDPLKVLRWTRREPARLGRYLDELAAAAADFARLQAAAGADVICIAEPTATGDILGGELFGEFVLGRLNALTDAIRQAGARAVVHICGNVAGVRGELAALRADALSVDSMVDVAALARGRPPWQAMGNVSTFLLASGGEKLIMRECRGLVEAGVRLVAPACGIIPTTPAASLAAMSRAVRRTS